MMQDFGLVSIITPLYNRADLISNTIRSVQSQTYKNWEMLITDDCSTDNGCEVVEDFIKNDSRIKLFRLSVNGGAGVARNNSIEKAQGKFIAFLDSDDIWTPMKLEKQLNFMVSRKCAMSFTSVMNINDAEEVTGLDIAPSKHTFNQNKKDDKVSFSTCVYDASVLGKVYMPLIRKRQDWGLVLKLLKECKYALGMKEPLCYYRIGQEALSKNKRSLIKYHYIVYQEILGWNKLHAVIYFWLVYVPSNIKKKLLIKLTSC